MRIRARLIVKNYELEERRKALGITQRDFAEIVAIGINRFSLIEQMKAKPTEEEAMAMALELDTSPEKLFPKGYEKIVDVFKTKHETITDYVPPMLDESNDHIRLMEKTDAKMTLEHAIEKANLSQKELEILNLRFGLDGKGHYSLEEVGHKYGVTRERVRQLEGKVLMKLKYALKSNSN